jgi:integrase
MSETIKVLCYKSKTLSDGKHPLVLCVCKDKKRKYQSLGISVCATHWDFKKNQLKEDCPDYVRIQLVIDTEIGKIKRKALDNRLEGKEFTVTTLLETSEKPPMQTVGELYLSYIEGLKRENRVRYAGMYQISYNSFIKFNKHLDIPFIDIDTGWLKRYEQWMRSQNFAVNTIGTRLRHLRVIFNQALDMKLITTDNYPFRAYKVSKMNQQTAKRALSKKDIINIINYKGKSELEILAIDIFAFSYFTAGINFIDIALLKDGNIIDNRVVYYRHKTKKRIIVPLQPKAIELIDKYRGGAYLFPILSAFHKTEVQIADRLHKVLGKVNKYLKQIGKELKLPIPLTTYVARHSYATVLKRSGVSTSIISESLGHSTERITQVYLDSFGNDQMDEAMKNLL